MRPRRASGGVLEMVLAGVLLEEYFEYSVVIKCSGVLEGVSKIRGIRPGGGET